MILYRKVCLEMDINSLSGIEFENVCQQLIEKMGFYVETTKASGDGGIDLIANNNQPILSGRYIIQCKRYSGSVGEPIIRDLYGVITSERANKGILMTTGYFTKSAISFAEGKQIELIDGAKLNGLLIKYGMLGLISETDKSNIEQKFNTHNLSFRKSFNNFDNELNVFLFDVDNSGLYDDISAQYVTLRIYEALQMAIYTNRGVSEQIALFCNILKCMRIDNVDFSECESVYYQYLENANGYKDVITNVAMPHGDSAVGDFWLNLMIASGMYDLESNLKELIDYHKAYITDLLALVNNFGVYDIATEWIKDYENSLEVLKESI